MSALGLKTSSLPLNVRAWRVPFADPKLCWLQIAQLWATCHQHKAGMWPLGFFKANASEFGAKYVEQEEATGNKGNKANNKED